MKKMFGIAILELLTCAYSIVVSDVIVKADLVVAAQTVRVARRSRTIAFRALSVGRKRRPLADRLLAGWLLSDLFKNWTRFSRRQWSFLHV